MNYLKPLLVLSAMASLTACSVAGLSAPPSFEVEEAPVKRISNAEMQTLLTPPVTRGTSTSYTYAAVRCNASTLSEGCDNVDLITDEGMDDTGDNISFGNTTENTSTYYMFMNAAGKCLVSSSDTIKTTDCNPEADKQKFRLSYESFGPGDINANGEDNEVQRYNFSVIPKVNYQGNTQTYNSSTNPETYAWKKKDSGNNIQQGADCASEGSKCIFHFIDADAAADYPSDFDGQYEFDNPDGFTSTGDWFFLQNSRFVKKTSKGRCMRPHDGKLQQRKDKSKFKCSTDDPQQLWAVFNVTATTS